jgi:hypothetical protein
VIATGSKAGARDSPEWTTVTARKFCWPGYAEESCCFDTMKVARLFKLFMVPGENVENPGGLENKNPMDDLNTDLQAWGGRVS